MKLSSFFATALGLGLIVLGMNDTWPLKAAPGAEKLRQFIYVVHLAPRLFEEKAWTQQDREITMRHFERLKAAGDHGPVILAGRTQEAADKTFGIVVFEAADTKDAQAFMENDPAVKAGIMTADLHPYLGAVQRTR